MAQDPDVTQPPIPTPPMGKPDGAPPEAQLTDPEIDDVDIPYWLDCLEDAERAEREWRKRGREVVGIYRNEAKASNRPTVGAGPVSFNILYSNTEVVLPAVYSKPPEPVVRSRFTKPTLPPMMPPMGMMPPPMAGPGMGMPPPGLPPGAPPAMGAPPIAPAPPAAPPFAGAQAPVEAPPTAIGTATSPAVLDVNPAVGGMPPPGAPVAGPPAPPMMPPPGLPPAPPMPPAAPPQSDIETAASVMEKALEIVVDEEHSNEAIKMAIKDVLLPGRGTCRVRWRPTMETVPVMAGDGVTPLPGADGQPQTKEVKVWEVVDDEYVYWEDLLVDPVRAASDMNWIAFRHLFTRTDLEREFAGSPKYDQLVADNKLGEIFKWTDESAAKDTIGGGSAMKTASKLGDQIRKAMLWEI